MKPISQDMAGRDRDKGPAEASSGTADFVTVMLGRQLFGIPVLEVQDVLGHQRITRIPLAPPEVAGALNLRGRIVTAIDMRARLHMTDDRPADRNASSMSIVVEHGGEPYSLLVDSVGEVVSVPVSTFERHPSTLDPLWREMSTGIYRLDGQLMVVLDTVQVLNLAAPEAA